MVPGLAPGLVLVVAIAVAAIATARPFATVSPLIVGVVFGAVVANAWAVLGGGAPPSTKAGVSFAAKHVLRVGIVLLGFRLALSDLVDLGLSGAIVVAMVVSTTFFGTRALAKQLGVSPKLGILVATGYSICGASAIAAVDGVIEADEEETAYAVALVTLCGSLSIAILPVIGDLAGLSNHAFGAWAGGAVHDVAQVIATAATHGDSAVEAATIVKLTRVILLAPLVMILAVQARRRVGASDAPQVRQPLVPLFVVGFLAAVAIRSTGWLDDAELGAIKDVEQIMLVLALVGLGLGVRFNDLRRLGGRPLVLGLVAWLLVASVSFAGVTITGI